MRKLNPTQRLVRDLRGPLRDLWMTALDNPDALRDVTPADLEEARRLAYLAAAAVEDAQRRFGIAPQQPITGA